MQKYFLCTVRVNIIKLLAIERITDDLPFAFKKYPRTFSPKLMGNVVNDKHESKNSETLTPVDH